VCQFLDCMQSGFVTRNSGIFTFLPWTRRTEDIGSSEECSSAVDMGKFGFILCMIMFTHRKIWFILCMIMIFVIVIIILSNRLKKNLCRK
jgi:hypothetical protein